MTLSLQEAAEAVSVELAQLRTHNDALYNETTDLRSRYETLLADFTSLRSAAKVALDERDYYMRECANLQGRFSSFCGMARDAIEDYRLAPFRPNGGAPQPTTEPATITENIPKDNEPIPQFLTEPQDNVRKIEGPLRLRRRIP